MNAKTLKALAMLFGCIALGGCQNYGNMRDKAPFATITGTAKPAAWAECTRRDLLTKMDPHCMDPSPRLIDSPSGPEILLYVYPGAPASGVISFHDGRAELRQDGFNETACMSGAARRAVLSCAH